MDRHHFGLIKDNFGGGAINTTVIIILAVVALSLVLLFVWGWYMKKLQREAEANRIPTYWIVAKDKMLRLLERALANRSKVELRFVTGSNDGRFINCSLEQYDDSTIILGIDTMEGLSKKWINRDIQGFFSVPAEEKDAPPQFFVFRSTLTDIRQDKRGSIHIAVQMPQRFEWTQKRSFLRLDPPSRLYRNIALWPEKLNDKKHPHPNIRLWGEPAVDASGPPFEEARIVNISGGGVRLLFTSSVIRKGVLPEFNKGTMVFVRLDLVRIDHDDTGEVADESIERYHLHGRVQNTYDDPIDGTREVGLAFVRFATPREKNPDFVEWSQPQTDGIHAVEQWVFHTHMDMHRDRG